MKSLFATVLFFSVLTAQAEVPKYKAQDVTCAQAKADVENYGSVLIIKKYLFGTGIIEVFKDKPRCKGGDKRRVFKTRTSEGLKCKMGYYCDWTVD